ncbi:MAG: class I SAM-dependent methyltransferase [bacterium]
MRTIGENSTFLTFPNVLRRIWTEIESISASSKFLNVEGGSVEQVRDNRLRLHHCANYAAAFTMFAAEARPLRILELGCGSGLLSAVFARLMPSHWSLVATDYSPRLIEHAQVHAALARVEFKCLEISDLKPEFLRNFDAVMFLEVIEHLFEEEAAKLFSRLYSGLSAGGMVILTTLDRSPFKRPFSGYGPHKVEYRYETLRDFLLDKRKIPFELVDIFRLIAPRIVRQAIKSEEWGGYFFNRAVALVNRVARSHPDLVHLIERLANILFWVYDHFLPRKRFNTDGYMEEVKLITQNVADYNSESFSLMAVLRKANLPESTV